MEARLRAFLWILSSEQCQQSQQATISFNSLTQPMTSPVIPPSRRWNHPFIPQVKRQRTRKQYTPFALQEEASSSQGDEAGNDELERTGPADEQGAESVAPRPLCPDGHLHLAEAGHQRERRGAPPA